MTFDLPRIRERFHRIPELAFSEFRTKALILEYLQALPGIRIRQFAHNTGILVEYRHAATPYRLFRADMDALPLQEQTGCAYTSEHPGMMHACGHDMHITILLGLVGQVCHRRPDVNALFLFQPAEEGKGGAEAVLMEGIIQEYDIDRVYALHVASNMPVGSIGSRAGIFFALPQEFDVRFIGKSAHVAFPEDGIDAMRSGIAFYNEMASRVSELAQQHRIIFHIGKMSAGDIRNVIADACVLEGTHRSFDKAVSEELNGLINQVAMAVAQAHHTDYQVDYLCKYDPVINAPAIVQNVKDAAAGEGIDYIESPAVMTGEDFGAFNSRYPGALFWLGSGCGESLHSPRFLPSADCLEVGLRVFWALLTQ